MGPEQCGGWCGSAPRHDFVLDHINQTPGTPGRLPRVSGLPRLSKRRLTHAQMLERLARACSALDQCSANAGAPDAEENSVTAIGHNDDPARRVGECLNQDRPNIYPR